MRQWKRPRGFYLISIPVLLVALFFHRRQAQFRGLGLFGASCPQCAAPLPTVRKSRSGKFLSPMNRM